MIRLTVGHASLLPQQFDDKINRSMHRLKVVWSPTQLCSVQSDLSIWQAGQSAAMEAEKCVVVGE
jgi:lysine/ornithine N-monooxygenase